MIHHFTFRGALKDIIEEILPMELVIHFVWKKKKWPETSILPKVAHGLAGWSGAWKEKD